jgi:hypothetical protein
MKLKSNFINYLNKTVIFEVFTAVVMKSIIFWDMTPCSLLSFIRRFGWTYCLNMEEICSSERSVETQQTTRRHIPEDDTLQDYKSVERTLNRRVRMKEL